VAKVVVLDVDGTLMDTNYLHVEGVGAERSRRWGTGCRGSLAPQASREGLEPY
jgi:phosphoglycolate phosphatase-like HAD superfamily hydrolase